MCSKILLATTCEIKWQNDDHNHTSSTFLPYSNTDVTCMNGRTLSNGMQSSRVECVSSGLWSSDVSCLSKFLSKYCHSSAGNFS